MTNHGKAHSYVEKEPLKLPEPHKIPSLYYTLLRRYLGVT